MKFASKYASIDGVEFPLWRYTFKTAAMTSFHAEKCCHLVSAHAASAWRICSSVRQFLMLIHSTFVLLESGISYVNLLLLLLLLLLRQSGDRPSSKTAKFPSSQIG